jgi:hypothetical protein
MRHLDVLLAGASILFACYAIWEWVRSRKPELDPWREPFGDC